MIDSKIQEELRAKYNPDGSDLRKAQLRMLDMLKYIDNVCNEQKIPYWLDSGTLLGAARHGGFIPWDDDADIGMLRKDAIRFKNYMLTHPNPNYIIQCRETDPGFFGNWFVLRDLNSEYIIDDPVHNIRKYKGLQVDIFHFDTDVVDTLGRICMYFASKRKAGIINNKIKQTIIYDRLMNWLILPFCRFLGHFLSSKKYLKHCYGSFFTKARPIDSVYPLSKIDFEGFSFSAPRDYEAYLRSLYGENCMELPSSNHRVAHKVKIIFY